MKKSPLLLLPLLISLSVHADTAPFVFGSYANNSHFMGQPYILNRDAQNNWILNNLPPFPKNVSMFYTEVSSCSGTNCFIGGISNGQKYYGKPAIMTSPDSGLTWSYQTISGLETAANNGVMLYPYCSDGICFMTGSYLTDKHEGIQFHSYIMRSADNGLHWTIAYNAANFSDPGSIQCVDQLCIAAGTPYSKSESPIPFLMSFDKGLHWQKSYPKINNFPGDDSVAINRGEKFTFNAGRFIYASGFVTDKNPRKIFPLFLTSDDAGHSWNTVQEIANLPTNNSISLADLKCHENTCVAVGKIDIVSPLPSSPKPLIIISHDNGTSWQLDNKLTNLPQEYTGAELNTVKYFNNQWFIGGHYMISANYYNNFPLILTSSTADSWSYHPVSLLTNNLESTYQVTGLNCNYNLCVMTGLATYPNNKVSPQAFFAQSENGGKTWQQVDLLGLLPQIFDGSTIQTPI